MNADSDALRNGRLREALRQLSEAEAWSRHDLPLVQLERECRSLCGSPAFHRYLFQHPSIRTAMEMGFYVIAWSKKHPGNNLDPDQELAFAIGYSLTQWIPTFLLIDGPIGRLFARPQSPLIGILDAKHFPILAVARNLVDAKRYRDLRNGIAHWSFRWNHEVSPHTIEVFGWRDDQSSDEVVATLPYREAMNYHEVMKALILALYPHVSGRCRCDI